MKWSDIDFERKTWSITGEPPPPNALVDLSDAATAILADLRRAVAAKADGYVFGTGVGTSGPKGRCRMKRMMDDHMERTLGDAEKQFVGWRWNDLRRTAALMLLGLGVQSKVWRMVIGLQTGDFREGRRCQAARAAVDRLAELLAAIRDGETDPFDRVFWQRDMTLPPWRGSFP